jgi:ABC-type sugar transport system permease subunit
MMTITQRSRPSTAVPERRTTTPTARRRRTTDLPVAIAMVSPAAIVIAVVAVFPVLYAIYLSFRDATVSSSGEWTGLSNYGDLLADPDFRTALLNTTLFTIVSVALEFAVGMAMALALHRSFRFRGLARTAVLIPWAFPVVVSALMWRLMLQDQVGIVSWLAHATGLTDQPILSDHTSLLVAAIGVDVWKSTPFIALLLLAGLQTIPAELNEAAIVDGATAVQRFFAVTLPQLRPAILVALLFRTLEAWSVYDLFWVMSDRQLASLSTYVYSGVRVSQLDFARGDAAAVFVFATSIVIALAYLRIFRSGGTGEEA